MDYVMKRCKLQRNEFFSCMYGKIKYEIINKYYYTHWSFVYFDHLFFSLTPMLIYSIESSLGFLVCVLYE